MGISGRGIAIGQDIVYTGTFAGAPSAVGRAGQLARFTDANNSVWISDGTSWHVLNGETLLISSSYPVMIAQTPTSITSGTGALVISTLPATYSGGIWMYFGAMGTKAAGFYWVVMSSTTAGLVYGTPQSAPSDTIPTDLFTEAGGPFAPTGVTSEITAYSFALPAAVLNTNGQLLGSYITSCTNSANAKTLRFKFGATTMANYTHTNVVGRMEPRWCVKNAGKNNVQTGNAISAISTSVTRSAVDTSAAITLTITMQNSTATEYFVIEEIEARLMS